MTQTCAAVVVVCLELVVVVLLVWSINLKSSSRERQRTLNISLFIRPLTTLVSEEPTPEELQVERERLSAEFDEAYAEWKKVASGIVWKDTFVEELKHASDPPRLSEMIDLPLGDIYKEDFAPDNNLGLIPLMASSSEAQIGALPAESFCERVLSCANLVLTEGNTLLGSEELEMLVVLRMNRNFMELMRKRYANVTLDQFNEPRPRL